MAKALKTKIDFDHCGIGSVLRHYDLEVPENQREYKWEEKHVKDLYQDLADAIGDGEKNYFLGTIVLTAGEGKAFEVADGQQRLATTTMLLAAIRDYLEEHQQSKSSATVESRFLTEFDYGTQLDRPKLTLNLDDRDFFRKHVLSGPSSPDRKARPAHISNKRIMSAAKIAKEHVAAIVKPHGASERWSVLNRWLEYIEHKAQVVVLKVPDDLNAYDMFETLNDRGLKTSQSDLLKNYLLKEAGDRRKEAKQQWDIMRGKLEGIGDDDDIILAYLRIHTVLQYGFTKDRDFFRRLKGNIKGKGQAIDYLASLANSASDYAAILTADHSKWAPYHPNVREYIRTLKLLKVAPMAFLMLAVSKAFKPKEAERALAAFVCWSVRFLIVGGAYGWVMEEACANAAHKVYKGTVSTTEDLIASLGSAIPVDSQFEKAFSIAEVTKHSLARYYLRSLEAKKKNETKEPYWVPNENVDAINLEHVLPLNPGTGWNVKPEVAEVYARRLGNMVLLLTKKNENLGNKPFADKKKVLATAPYHFPSTVGKKTDWGTDEIDERQAKLAAVAVETWPIKPK
jgi:hypothetical protein